MYVSYFDYYYHLQQRPNYMFNVFADKGYPVLLCHFKYNDRYENPRKNLYLIPYSWLKYILCEDFPKVFDVPNGYPYSDMPDFFKYINKKSLVLYELIDDWSLFGDSGTIIKAESMFKKLIKRDNTFVFTSANNLYEFAKGMGTPEKNCF